MKILAIDPSLTCWGIATLGAVTTWKPPGKGVERLLECEKQVSRLIGQHDPHIVVLEGYSHASKYQQHQMGELGGVVRLAIHRWGWPFVEVPPKALKKWATGKGNATKEMMLVSAIRRLNYQGHSNDEADALWLLHMAGAAYDLPWAAKVPQLHQQVDVEWPTVDIGVTAP